MAQRTFSPSLSLWLSCVFWVFLMVHRVRFVCSFSNTSGPAFAFYIPNSREPKPDSECMKVTGA